MNVRRYPSLIVALALAAACAPASDDEARPQRPVPRVQAPTEQEIEEAVEDFHEVREGFLEWYFEAHPVRASELGVHDYHARLPALDRRGVQRRIDDLLEWLADLEQIRFDLMRGDDRYDYAVLEYGIRGELLDLEEARTWANDPGTYTETLARGLAAVADRQYAPLADRTGALAARMGGGIRLLEAARANVQSPPRLWTQLAVEDARGLIAYLESGLPAMLAAQGAEGFPAELEEPRSRLRTALEAHVEWLSTQLTPRATGSYRLGRYLLERKLLYTEHVSLELGELERLNTDAIAEYRRRMVEVAREIDPDRSVQAIMDSINADGPAPSELLSAAREMTARARDWTVESGVVEVPRDSLPTVRETLPFARERFSSMNAPGPFDDPGLAAFYNLTNALPDWDEERRREHMTYFSWPGLMITTLHETFPGHYVERQYERELTGLRRVFATTSFTAGWAHYAAEMALDQGFSDDPGLRLEQLRRALQRHARWHAVFQIHAEGAALDDVVQSFMDLAFFEEAPARREVIRATREPAFMTDALGRMQIFELRNDYKAFKEERREEFSLTEFHGELLRLGLPFPLAREALMPRRTRSRASLIPTP